MHVGRRFQGSIHQLFEARLKHIIKCENCHLNLINIKICECEKRVNQRKSTTVIDGTTYFSDLDEDEEN
ncbi:Protein translocase subunit [Frankliniella fusca]|uniref:Protein translocase subunit n=1 Tax=Frankliniella fusca TaxID=407009 RepID=A0AAE1HP67_9NEOP|nr:Protein translocase subunit [Frankliniella fusca]